MNFLMAAHPVLSGAVRHVATQYGARALAAHTLMPRVFHAPESVSASIVVFRSTFVFLYRVASVHHEGFSGDVG